MNANRPIPIIRLELEGIKETICHMVADQSEEISAAVQEKIGAAIDGLDIQAMVEKGVESCISDAVESYFKFGQGRHTISQAVYDALDETIGKCDTRINEDKMMAVNKEYDKSLKGRGGAS